MSTCSRCHQPNSVPVTVGPESFFACPTCAQPIRAHLTATPTMTDEAINTPFPVHSHGKVFKVYACGEAWHPSWWSFQDELETRESWWNIKTGDIVLDVGADFGSYALSALAQGAGHVYAWSPPFKHPSEPVECRTMLRSAQLNGWSERITAFGSGLWSKPGYLAAFDGPRMAEWFATPEEATRRIQGESGNCASFRVTPIDPWVGRVDWMKLDVEGAELEIMRGAVNATRDWKPNILLEHHYHIDPDCETKCDAFLAELGYRKIGTRPHGMIAHSLYVARPESIEVKS